ncbi:hypothetical protein GQ53DRAFT_741430 [Thozetella sp. PMI_491]|nr:hypothetical protein GQ53DRAFT_741430 [Thozetella sp. PMI_491]
MALGRPCAPITRSLARAWLRRHGPMGTSRSLNQRQSVLTINSKGLRHSSGCFFGVTKLCYSRVSVITHLFSWFLSLQLILQRFLRPYGVCDGYQSYRATGPALGRYLGNASRPTFH